MKVSYLTPSDLVLYGKVDKCGVIQIVDGLAE
jgi:hypothetical protein